MEKANFKKSIIALTVVCSLVMSSSAVFAKNNDENNKFKNVTSVTTDNTLPSLTPKSGVGSNGEVSALASSSKSITTYTGGIRYSKSLLNKESESYIIYLLAG